MNKAKSVDSVNSSFEYYFDFFDVERKRNSVERLSEKLLGRKLSAEETNTIEEYMDKCLEKAYDCGSKKSPARIRIKKFGGFGIQISAYYYSSTWKYLMSNKSYFEK